MKFLFLIFFLFCFVGAAFGAEVKNVRHTQEGDKVVFEFDVVGDEAKTDVSIDISIEKKRYKAYDLHLSGDFGEVNIGRGKKIVWDVLQDFPEGFEGEFDWEIKTQDRLIQNSFTQQASKTRFELRDKEHFGFGVGPGLEVGLGYFFYSDYNVTSTSQIHAQVFYGDNMGDGPAGTSSESFSNKSGSYKVGYEVTKVESMSFFLSYRKFLSKNSGFFGGIGGGVQQTVVDFNSFHNPDEKNATTSHSANHKAWFGKAEIGWQGNDGFYFQIALQPAFVLSSEERYDVVIDKYGDDARSWWNEINRAPHSLLLGFGWFF